MLSFLRPTPDATKKVSPEKIARSYRWHQTGVIAALCLGYYIFRLIFTTEQNDIMRQYGFMTAEVGLVLSCFGIGYGVMSWIPSYLVGSKGFSAAFAKWLVGLLRLCDRSGCLTTYFFSSDKTVIVVDLLLMGTLIYAPLTLVGLMVNEVVPKFAWALQRALWAFSNTSLVKRLPLL